MLENVLRVILIDILHSKQILEAENNNETIKLMSVSYVDFVVLKSANTRIISQGTITWPKVTVAKYHLNDNMQLKIFKVTSCNPGIVSAPYSDTKTGLLYFSFQACALEITRFVIMFICPGR